MMKEQSATLAPDKTQIVQLINRVIACAKYTEALCTPLQTEDYIPQVAEFVSPPKWHLGHTCWFYETFVLKPFLKNYTVFDPAYNQIFNSYYISAGKRVARDNRGSLSRPTVDEVYAYRRHVQQALLELPEQSANENGNDMIQRLILGLNHEQQHQELLITDLKYMFFQNPLLPVYDKTSAFDEISSGNPTSKLLTVDEGIYAVGNNGDDFCYDNEMPEHEVKVPAFSIADRPVLNGEYLEFIEDGGYQKFQYWHDEGWKWIQQNQIAHPLYWLKDQNDWMLFTLNGVKKLEPDDLLKHVSFYEAFAFANWKGLRLPTEFEWEVAANQFNWGKRWEWTNSAYLPYPGFKPLAGALGEYNGKFMVSQMVLRGASAATPEGHSRATYRNFFYPAQRWQFTGIRLAK